MGNDPETKDMSTQGKLYIYEVNVGATFWVAAENLRQALHLMWGLGEEYLADEDELQINLVPPEKAAQLRMSKRSEVAPGEPMLDIVKEPGVIACSEWP